MCVRIELNSEKESTSGASSPRVAKLEGMEKLFGGVTKTVVIGEEWADEMCNVCLGALNSESVKPGKRNQ